MRQHAGPRGMTASRTIEPMTKRKSALCILALLPGLSPVALAGPGKAGLWEVRTSLNFSAGGFQISPEQIEQMRQFGLDVPGLDKPFVARQCITPEQAARDELPRPQAGDSGCALQNVRHNGNLWNADIACSGSLQGRGNLAARFESDQRFAGTWRFTGRSTQVPTDIDMSNPFSGRWLGANCGTVAPNRD